MLLRPLWRFVSFLSSLCLTFVVGVGLYAASVCRLDGLQGERVYYLDSASSQGLRKEELTLLDLPRIEGESVRFSLNGESEQALVARVTGMYDATVLFVEEGAGERSYYCYTSAWNNALALQGERVNLHIAVREGKCVVGTPIIFDGF